MHHKRLRHSAHDMRLALGLGAITALWLGMISGGGTVADDVGRSVAKSGSTCAALHAAVEKNVSYCRDWLAAKDWKSLRQTADGLTILAEVLGQQADDEAWRREADEMAKEVQALQAAADDKQLRQCQQLIDRIDALQKVWTKLAPQKKAEGGGPKLEKLPSLRPLMHLMDATHADAKAALALGDLAEAKSMAVVLSELGRVVSNQRADAEWRGAGESLVRAALEAADEKQSDAKTVRQQLRGVYERCEACHKRQR